MDCFAALAMTVNTVSRSQRAVGNKGFIAGRFNQIADQTFFNGSWTYGQIGKF
jgi:hypothetical protein